MDIVSTFIEKQDQWMMALLEHIQISLTALIVAVVIAVPLGIVVSHYSHLKEWLLQIAGIFQTIPSLALLGLFIPFIGIGTLPAVVVLVVYAIFPILQGTLTGLSEIDPSLEDAATAFGMTKWEKLKTYQLELAMPVLMSGVRTASIMIIGTATLAALVGAGGLGTFILLGIDRNNAALILIGATSSALLAIIFSSIIKLLQTKKLKTILMALITAIVVLGLSFVPTTLGMNQKLVIAGKLGAEPEIMINMYKLLIEEETNMTVDLRPNFGKTTFLYEALKAKSIDIYPEYTGTIATTLLTPSVNTASNDANQVFQIAKEGILSQDNLVYLKPSQFQNTYALAVRKEYALSNNLRNISDLKQVENTATAGFSLEFNDREDGNIGLEKIYGLNLNVRTFEPALRYQAIDTGDINIIDVYSTDSQIITSQLQLLNDDKQLFPPYQVAPLMRSETLEQHPELQSILEKLSGKISTQEMAEMNYAVDVKGESARDVARAYLVREKLIKE